MKPFEDVFSVLNLIEIPTVKSKSLEKRKRLL
jgi:hypothetical protein